MVRLSSWLVSLLVFSVGIMSLHQSAGLVQNHYTYLGLRSFSSFKGTDSCRGELVLSLHSVFARPEVELEVDAALGVELGAVRVALSDLSVFLRGLCLRCRSRSSSILRYASCICHSPQSASWQLPHSKRSFITPRRTSPAPPPYCPGTDRGAISRPMSISEDVTSLIMCANSRAFCMQSEPRRR